MYGQALCVSKCAITKNDSAAKFDLTTTSKDLTSASLGSWTARVGGRVLGYFMSLDKKFRALAAQKEELAAQKAQLAQQAVDGQQDPLEVANAGHPEAKGSHRNSASHTDRRHRQASWSTASVQH